MAAAKLGLKKIPFQIRPGLTDEEKKQLAMDLNIHRRHLSPKQLDELVIKYRKEGKSLRQIGEELGISHETVRRNISTATVTGETVEFPKTITGKDGKRRPAKLKPAPCITVNTIKEVERATDACQVAGPEFLPGKTIDLKRAERLAREKQNQDLRELEYEDVQLGQAKLFLGDFRIRGKEIADESVDVFFADPPYAKNALPLWLDLAKFATKKLKPSGILISYSGVLYLPQVHEMLGEHLQYLWTAAIYHTGGKKLVSAVKVQQAWKPILIYYKPPLNKYWKPFTDMVSGGQSKSNHIWEQAVDEAAHYIKALCPKNGTLLDPMMGAGTSLVAGLKVNKGLKCIGIEIDPAAYGTSEERIKKALASMTSGSNNNI
jgi:hypothetical protein